MIVHGLLSLSTQTPMPITPKFAEKNLLKSFSAFFACREKYY